MAALLDAVQQYLMRQALEAWPDMPRAETRVPSAPIESWHQQLDVLEARLAARRMRRLDAEAAITETPTGDADGGLDDLP